jgi:tryptophanyl-tRNA synthetase
MTRKRSLTGIKPSGTLHVGNVLGAVRPALELAADYDAFYFIADYHSLTGTHGERMRRWTYEVAAAWLALGLDPERVTFYRQSDLPEVFELQWILSCFAGKGLLNRAHAYKAAVDANREAGRDPDDGVNMGLFNYPVLMAADILLFSADVVPVGRDQRQHVEIARDIANSVNVAVGEQVLHLPEALIDEQVHTIPGMDGRKMSKSYDNVIPAFSEPKALRKLVMKIVTDSTPVEDPKDPDNDNVFALFRLFASAAEAAALAGRYRAGGMGYGEAKQELFEVLERELGPARERYDEWMANPQSIDEILDAGAERARELATPLMERLRDAVGTSRANGSSPVGAR